MSPIFQRAVIFIRPLFAWWLIFGLMPARSDARETPATKPQAPAPRVLSLSLEEFTEMLIKNSPRSQTTKNSFFSSQWSWMASLRGLTWPSLRASASRTRSFSDSDTGAESESFQNIGDLTLSQPLLTGTDLQLNSRWTRSNTYTSTLGVPSGSRSRLTPAITASLKQPLFIFNRNTSLRSRKQANISWENSQNSYEGELLSIEQDARSLYYNLLRLEEVTKVERKKFESARLVHNATKALVRVGKLAEVELVRADIRAKKDLRRIQNTENNSAQRLNEAKDLILVPQNTELRLTSTLQYAPFNISLERLVETALQHNLGLLVARRQVELSEISLQQAKEADNPKLNVNGTYSLTKNRTDPAAPLDPYSWTAGISVDWPLLDASQTRLRVKQAELSLANTRIAYDTRVRDLKVAVNNAYLEIKRTEEQIADLDQQRERAEANLKAIRLQYENGLTRLTDVFDAENELRDLELERLDLLIVFNTSVDKMKVIVGRDLGALSEGKLQ